MMYIFQRKIIYMGAAGFPSLLEFSALIDFGAGYIPMGARTEMLKDVTIPSSVHAERISVHNGEKTTLSGVLVWHKSQGATLPVPKTVIVYFQGKLFV